MGKAPPIGGAFRLGFIFDAENPTLWVGPAGGNRRLCAKACYAFVMK